MELLPYPPRPFQADAVASIESTAHKGGHLVMEAPTGTGKTVVLLAGVLQSLPDSGRKLLYVTRTNSQQEQAVRELVAIRRASGRPFRCFPLQGRSRLCLKLEDSQDADLEEASPEELSHYCTHAKALTETDATSPNACSYYAGLQRRTDEDLQALTGPEPLTAEAFKALGRGHAFCSYEATKRLLPTADVVVAPYVFAFDAGLRQHLCRWWGIAPRDLVLVVDEAHNLPDYLRESASPRLSRQRLRRALREAEALQNPLLLRSVTLRTFLEALDEAIATIVAEYCHEDDAFIPPFELEANLLQRFQTTTRSLLEAADHLAQLGELVRERRRLAGRVPRSSLLSVAAFLRHWLASDEEGYVKLATREPVPALEAYLVDAARAAEALHEFHATIHASGTLEPLAEYRDTLGLGDDCRLERYPSPFPQEALQVFVTRGLTTKYDRLRSDPALVDRLQEVTRRLLQATRVSVAVFFPSHQLLEEFREVGVFAAGGSPPLIERRGLAQESLMAMIRDHREASGHSVLAGVLGGRLSEGIDFPGRQLEGVFIVGAPFPKPTAHHRALFQYYESRLGRGWEYAVQAPTVRRLRQALGRLIRGPQDRGFAVVLDERAASLLSGSGVAARVESPETICEAFAHWQSEHA